MENFSATNSRKALWAPLLRNDPSGELHLTPVVGEILVFVPPLFQRDEPLESSFPESLCWQWGIFLSLKVQTCRLLEPVQKSVRHRANHRSTTSSLRGR